MSLICVRYILTTPTLCQSPYRYFWIRTSTAKMRIWHCEKDTMNQTNSNLVLTVKIKIKLNLNLKVWKVPQLWFLNVSSKISPLLAKDQAKMLTWRYAIYFKDPCMYPWYVSDIFCLTIPYVRPLSLFQHVPLWRI